VDGGFHVRPSVLYTRTAACTADSYQLATVDVRVQTGVASTHPPEDHPAWPLHARTGDGQVQLYRKHGKLNARHMPPPHAAIANAKGSVNGQVTVKS